MINSLYIVTAEPYSGKSVVALGMMELLKRHSRRVGFFRPIVPSSDRVNNEIDLIRTRYGIKTPIDQMHALSNSEAMKMVADGKNDEIIKKVLAKFKAIQAECDFVLCLGTDMTGVANAIELDFNAEIANNLGCPVMPVINGAEKTVGQIVEVVKICSEMFEENNCDILASIVNRSDPKMADEVKKTLDEKLGDKNASYVIPEAPVLGQPTVGEVATVLEADCSVGDPNELLRLIESYKVIAMEPRNVLGRLTENSLLITSGDRDDVILSCLLASRATAYPSVAGLLLTGGFRPDPSIQKLINDMRNRVPVMCVETDTYTTAMNVNQINPRITAENGRKIAYALEAFESSVDIPALEKRISVVKSTRRTPIMFEFELLQRAKNAAKHIVLPEGKEDRILRAAEQLLLRGIVKITLLGEEEEIKRKITSLGLNLEGVEIIDPQTSELRDKYADIYFEKRKHKGVTKETAMDVLLDATYFGTLMVVDGIADGMVSGSINTTQHTIRPAFEVIGTQEGCAAVSSVFLMCLEDRVLVYGDCAVNPNPDATILADIAVSSADTAKGFGIEPYVAMLSYSTGASGAGKDVEKVREASELAKKLRPDLQIEGPIQYDAAVDMGVAKTKLPDSKVAGHASVFIFPDLNTGNNTYKAVQRSAGAVAIGPVLQGLKKPVNDLSRGCTVTDIVNTVAITAIQASQIEE